jgi:NADH:ubiquinone oxidoreductase subunit 6 (subunit J)
MVFFFKNIVYSFVSFVFVVFLILYILWRVLHMEFLALIIGLIYLGAMLILFIFILMVLITEKDFFVKRNIEKFSIADIFLFSFFIVKLYCLFSFLVYDFFIDLNDIFFYEWYHLHYYNRPVFNPVSLGLVMYSEYFTEFILIGVLMLFILFILISMLLKERG